MDPRRKTPHVPGPSLWPVGFAIGVAVALLGLVVRWQIIALGIVIALIFGILWIRDAAGRRGISDVAEVESEYGPGHPGPTIPPPSTRDKYSRNVFLELSTLGVGGIIGGLVTLPALGFMIGPAFLKQGVKDHDLGPVENFPQDAFVVATYMSDPAQGEVSRRTAFVRYNGLLGSQPSFTIISNHCVHLGCPVQPNGPVYDKQSKTYGDVTLIPAKPSGFGCPCHGGQYDSEGNRVAGPPVRALDRYSFSIRNGHLYVGAPYSVAKVEGEGAAAKIHKNSYSFPGEQASGIESWLYPIQPPN